MTKLRYDYPLVLVKGADGSPVRSLSGIVNDVLQQVSSPGIRGERMRKNVLNVEMGIRARSAAGRQDTLTRLWEDSAAEVLGAFKSDPAATEKAADNLARARSAVRVDGEVLDCDAQTAMRVMAHIRSATEERRAARVRHEIGELVLRLSDVLAADALKSEGRNPEALQKGVGSRQEELFDFGIMSQILKESLPADPIPATRRRRIEAARSVLRAQKFFAPAGDGQTEAYSFVFHSCAEALRAFRERLPAMVDLVRALRIAELELANRYCEDRHDAYFASFGADSLTPEEIAFFPSYLVCVDVNEADEAEFGRIVEILGSDLPIKILAQVDDLGMATPTSVGISSPGAPGASLARMAVNLGTAVVVQTTTSLLCQMQDEIVAAIRSPRPALLSVFSGTGEAYAGLPPYLVSAAAVQSRVFPAFVFYPDAGFDLASRFSVAANPQPERLWTVAEFLYEDPDLQRVTEEIAFTPVDFLACDARLDQYFTPVNRADWNESMLPASEALALDDQSARGREPWIWMVDDDGKLRRVRVAPVPLRLACGFAQVWRGLQELGGIDNSHVRRALERERQSWEEQKRQEIEALKKRLAEEESVAPGKEPGARAEAAPSEVLPAAVEVPSPDEPYIETPRCTSCNECVSKNSRMFAYNENKQAYIKDVTAGTYRDLVEAAERCAVAIIHPGKPRNPDEPNLEELVQRAAAFQ